MFLLMGAIVQPRRSRYDVATRMDRFQQEKINFQRYPGYRRTTKAEAHIG